MSLKDGILAKSFKVGTRGRGLGSRTFGTDHQILYMLGGSRFINNVFRVASIGLSIISGRGY